MFPNSTIKTESSRQISCEPLKRKKYENTIRLICMHENLEFAEKGYNRYRYYIYITTINENFDGLSRWKFGV